MNGAALLESVKGHNVRSKLILGDCDTPGAGGTSVTDEASKSEVPSSTCDRLAILPINETTENDHGQSLSWERGRGVHTDNNVSVPTNTDANEFSMIVERRVLSTCEADAVFVSVFLRVEVSSNCVSLIIEDLDD
jgi:hypothetical protein